MTLEVIKKPATEKRYELPLLFVHGGGASASCWDAFQTYFAEAGFDTYALSLRGHGKSPAGGILNLIGFRHYLDDIRSVVDGLDRHPILIGHSWGGYLVQKYLACYSDCPAAALLSSPAPEWGWGLTWRMFKMHPFLVTLGHLAFYPHIVYSRSESVRNYLFRKETPQEQINEYLRHVQPISSRMYLETIFSRPTPRQSICEIMVLGCDGDALYPESVIRRTAASFGVEPVILPGLCHMLMLDGELERAALPVLEWLVHHFSNAQK